MIDQQYVDRISIRFKRRPDFAQFLSSVENLFCSAAVAMLALVLLFSCFQAVGSFYKQESKPVKVTVKPGDTLWQYAKKHGSKDRYILSRLDEIARLNKLGRSTAIQPGMEIVIPR